MKSSFMLEGLKYTYFDLNNANLEFAEGDKALKVPKLTLQDNTDAIKHMFKDEHLVVRDVSGKNSNDVLGDPHIVLTLPEGYFSRSHDIVVASGRIDVEAAHADRVRILSTMASIVLSDAKIKTFNLTSRRGDIEVLDIDGLQGGIITTTSGNVTVYNTPGKVVTMTTPDNDPTSPGRMQICPPSHSTHSSPPLFHRLKFSGQG